MQHGAVPQTPQPEYTRTHKSVHFGFCLVELCLARHVVAQHASFGQWLGRQQDVALQLVVPHQLVDAAPKEVLAVVHVTVAGQEEDHLNVTTWLQTNLKTVFHLSNQFSKAI